MLTLEKNWSSPQGPGEAILEGLGAAEKELLLSTGSMTLKLEERCSVAVSIELRRSAEIDLPVEICEYLGLETEPETEPKKRALEREVWLVADGTRLIYARTLIPLDCIDTELLDLLKSNSEEPIGRVLSAEKIPFSKLKLQLANLRSAELARDLNLKPDTLFKARRYILFNDDTEGDALMTGERRLIKAVVFEIFNPALTSQTLQPAP